MSIRFIELDWVSTDVIPYTIPPCRNFIRFNWPLAVVKVSLVIYGVKYVAQVSRKQQNQG